MDKRILIRIAKDAIMEELTRLSLIDRAKLLERYPWLGEMGATFVTLNKEGQLRGCIGSIVAHRDLVDDVIINAKAAAFSDPRFESLRAEELEALEIEISLLTTPQTLGYSDTEDLKAKIRPGIDGVILQQGYHQATYLPSVWEQLPGFEQFFATLCQKAGLKADCLEYRPTIQVYQAEKIEES
jgi:AmmeMemoRadiSam system protein A